MSSLRSVLNGRSCREPFFVHSPCVVSQVAGYSEAKESFPYVIPGPVDTWGGTWHTSGWRTDQVNIFFGIEKMPDKSLPGEWKLIITLLDYSKRFSPLLKVSINDYDHKQLVRKPDIHQPEYTLNKYFNKN